MARDERMTQYLNATCWQNTECHYQKGTKRKWLSTRTIIEVYALAILKCALIVREYVGTVVFEAQPHIEEEVMRTTISN